MAQANGMFMLQGTNMREVIKYYNDTLKKDETKIYYLDKKVSTQDTLFLYYKSIEKTKDEIEKEELNNKIKDLENVCRDLTIQVLNLTPIEEGGEKKIEQCNV